MNLWKIAVTAHSNMDFTDSIGIGEALKPFSSILNKIRYPTLNTLHLHRNYALIFFILNPFYFVCSFEILHFSDYPWIMLNISKNCVENAVQINFCKFN